MRTSLISKKPELVEIFENKKLGYKAFFVVDAWNGYSKSCGGIRISPDVTLREVQDLAKGMTLKYSFANVQNLAGAKSGIRIPKNCPVELRKKIVESFGKNMKRYFQQGTYFPGTDIGSDIADIETILQSARAPVVVLEDTAYFTSFSVLQCALEGLKFLKKNTHEATVCIEGFGSIGSYLAEQIQRQKLNLRVVAVSTQQGAVYDERGLDLKKLIGLRKKHGDDCVKNYINCTPIEKEELYALPCDVLFLCAKSRTITKKVARRLQCSVISPATNFPLEDGVEESLHTRDIVYIPDFIANSGGSSCSFLHGNGVPSFLIWKYVKGSFSSFVQALLRCARSAGISPYKLAVVLAEQNYTLRGRQTKKKKPINGILQKISPKLLKSVYHLRRIQQSMRRNTRFVEEYCERS